MGPSPTVTGVIVADDDAMIRGILRSKLEAIGQTVFLASDGMEAVDLASLVQATLIILDLNMPRLNGLLACQRIRLIPHNAQTPIVVLTALHGKDAEAAAARVGATSFLTKPFASGPMLQVLSRFLQPADVKAQAMGQSADRSAEIALDSARPKHGKNVASGRNRQLDRDNDTLLTLRNTKPIK